MEPSLLEQQYSTSQIHGNSTIAVEVECPNSNVCTFGFETKPSQQQLHNEVSVFRHLKVFRFFCLLPLNVQSLEKISKLFTFLAVAFSAMTLFGVVEFLRATPHLGEGKITKALTVTELINWVLSPIWITISAIRNRREFCRCLQDLVVVQKRLGTAYGKMFPSILVMFLIPCVLIVIILTGIAIQGVVIGYIPHYFEIAYAMVEIYTLAWLLLFTYCVKIFSACFKKLAGWKITSNSGLHQVIRTQSKLTDMAYTLNRFFDIAVSMVLLKNFLVMIDRTVIIQRKLRVDVTQISFIDLVVFFLPVILLSYLLHSCHKAKKQAMISNAVIVNDLMTNYKHHNNFLALIHLSSRRLMMFKVFKSLVLDYKLGISLVAGLFTYLVMVYQTEGTPKTTPTCEPSTYA